MAAIKWLDRRVCVPGPHLTLCLSDAQFRSACKRLRCNCPPQWIRNEWSDATAHFFNSPSGLAVVVCLRGWEGRNPVEVAGLLIHEAVHVWQQYAASIGEDCPGAEQEAYAIQAISQELMQSFADQVSGNT